MRRFAPFRAATCLLKSRRSAYTNTKRNAEMKLRVRFVSCRSALAEILNYAKTFRVARFTHGFAVRIKVSLRSTSHSLRYRACDFPYSNLSVPHTLFYGRGAMKRAARNVEREKCAGRDLNSG